MTAASQLLQLFHCLHSSCNLKPQRTPVSSHNLLPMK
uniref:Uncharacterized protein n=1 Tax=Arundo donax TaxID=35708 RepID=A0A0A9AC86_ARUDO